MLDPRRRLRANGSDHGLGASATRAGQTSLGVLGELVAHGAGANEMREASARTAGERRIRERPLRSTLAMAARGRAEQDPSLRSRAESTGRRHRRCLELAFTLCTRWAEGHYSRGERGRAPDMLADEMNLNPIWASPFAPLSPAWPRALPAPPAPARSPAWPRPARTPRPPAIVR